MKFFWMDSSPYPDAVSLLYGLPIEFCNGVWGIPQLLPFPDTILNAIFFFPFVWSNMLLKNKAFFQCRADGLLEEGTRGKDSYLSPIPNRDNKVFHSSGRINYRILLKVYIKGSL